jgi:hypothetical protein
MHPDLDPAPLLPALAPALASSHDPTKSAAAEAILVLTGPAAVAEHD